MASSLEDLSPFVVVVVFHVQGLSTPLPVKEEYEKEVEDPFTKSFPVVPRERVQRTQCQKFP